MGKLNLPKIVGALGIGALVGFATLPLVKGKEKTLENRAIVAQETAPRYETREPKQEYQIQKKAEQRQDNKYSYLTEQFINAMITEESHGNPRAESRVGARGLMQLMEATWKEETKKLYGKTSPFSEAYNPKINREVGESYCRTISDFCSKYHPDWQNLSDREKQSLITAAYNGGIGRLRQKNFDIREMPYETRNHVRKVMRHIR